MDIKKLAKKLIRAKEIILKDEPPLTDLEKQLMETFSFDLLDIKKNQNFDILLPHNDNNTLTTDQHYRLRLVEKTGTGSTAIH